MQLYFLSVLANLLAGGALASDYLTKRYPALQPWRALFEGRPTRLTLAIAAVAVGVLKLFVYANFADASQVAVLADLIPALAGIVVGATLAGQALEIGTDRKKGVGTDGAEGVGSDREEGDGSDRATGDVPPPEAETPDEAAPAPAPPVTPDGTVEKASRLALRNRVAVGFAGIGAAILHFLFGGVILF